MGIHQRGVLGDGASGGHETSRKGMKDAGLIIEFMK
jgi:hypothetical protein